jgi:hypothetical protein
VIEETKANSTKAISRLSEVSMAGVRRCVVVK